MATEELEVANKILAQLGGAGALKLMIGAKNLYGDENSLSIAWAARAKNGAKGVNIKLDGDDTYTMNFRKVVRREVKTVSLHQGIHVEDLVRVFQDQTGLVLAVPTIRRA